MVGWSRCRMCLAKMLPMTPYWNRCSGLGLTLAPTSSSTHGPLQGRHDGGDAGPADVLEEAAQEQAAGDHGAGVAGADDGLDLVLGQELPAAADGVVRLFAQGHDGRFFHADDLRAVEDLDAVAARRRPARQRLDLGLVADQNDAQVGIGGDRLHGAGDDRTGRMVAAHRVQRDLHGLLLLFRRHDFAALVVAAVGADAVRQHRLVALAAVLDLDRLDVVMAAPFALAGVRRCVASELP